MLRPERISRQFLWGPYGFKQGFPLCGAPHVQKKGWCAWWEASGLMDLNGFACSFRQKLHMLCHTHDSHMVFVDTHTPLWAELLNSLKEVSQLIIVHSRRVFIFPASWACIPSFLEREMHTLVLFFCLLQNQSCKQTPDYYNNKTKLCVHWVHRGVQVLLLHAFLYNHRN